MSGSAQPTHNVCWGKQEPGQPGKHIWIQIGVGWSNSSDTGGVMTLKIDTIPVGFDGFVKVFPRTNKWAQRSSERELVSNLPPFTTPGGRDG